VAALNGPTDATHEMCKIYEERRNILMSSLEKIRILAPFRPSGAFYVWARIKESWRGYQGKHDSWAMTNYLIDQAGIGSAPGEVFGPSGAAHIRFAFSCPTEQTMAAAELLPSLF
jgi:aspartate/methionine/tyrosine aminotransferase